MRKVFFGKPISKKTLSVCIIVSILLLNPCSSSFALGSAEAIVNPPLSIGKPVLITPSIYRLTEKYVVTKDINGLSFLDVETGKPAQAKDFVDDACSQTYLQLPDGDQSVKRFTYSQDSNGDQFISTDNTQVLRLKNGLFCRFLKNKNGKLLLSVWDATIRNMLWEQEVAVDVQESRIWAQIFDNLLHVYVGQTCYFFDINSGQLRLTVQPVQVARSKRWNNFLLVGKFLIDTDKMAVVKEFENESLMLDVGRVYNFSHPEKKEPGWYSFVDLGTMEETFFKLDMPQGSYTQGVCNGFFMCWNSKSASAQIIDPLTAKVYFSHPIGQTHSHKWGFYENGRQILFFDAAQMSCFDPQSKKLLWEKEFVTRTGDLGNGYFWEPTMDDSTIRVFGLTNPKKSVNVVIDKGHLMPFIFPSDSCVLSLDVAGQGYSRILKRFDWDGKVTQLDALPFGNENLTQPFVFKGIVYAWTENDQTGTLFKYINNGWSKVYQSSIYEGCSYFYQSDRFLSFYSDRNHIKVLNLGTNISKSIEAKEHTRFCFAASLLVIFFYNDSMVIEPSTCKVLDECAGQIAGSDKDTLYMVRGQVFKTFKKGKLTEKTLDLNATGKYGKYSASNDLLLADNQLFDREGRFCQELPTTMFGTTVVTVDGKTCIRQDNGNQINIYEVVESARYSFSIEQGKIVIKNIGKVTLKGKCWIEPSKDFVCAKLDKPIILDVRKGESFTIDADELESTVIFKTNGFSDSKNSGNNGMPAWLGQISLQDGEIINVIDN